MKSFTLLIMSLIIISIPSFSVSSITTVQLKEKAGVSSTNYPLTFGHVFKIGDVADSIAVFLGNTKLPTQVDVKTTYSDGSVRFAIITVIIPSISSGQVLPLTLTNAASSTDTDALTKDEILNTDVGAVTTLSDLSGSGYTGDLKADLRSALENSAQLNYWLKGSNCTEVLVKQDLNPSLNAAWEIRFYPTTNYGIRISNAIENVNADYRGHIRYGTQIELGFESPQTKYQKSSTLMSESSRWRKVLWLGKEPPETELRYDISYLISTGAVMNYNTDLVVPEETIIATHATWKNSNHDIMENGIIMKYFPTTGGRQDIGVLPTWTVRYLLTMDNRLKEMMLNSGELIASAPIHYRESNELKSFFGHPISIDDRPTIWTNSSKAHTYGSTNDRLPPPIGDVDITELGWTVDRAHQGSFSYLPYLVTGDYFFLEEIYYWAAWCLSASNYDTSYRNYAKGLIEDQVRGEAWAFRNLVDAAAVANDGHLEKNYFYTKVNNNIIKWESENGRYPLNYWGIDIYATIDGLTAEVKYPTSPWMEDFMLLSLVHAKEQQFPTGTIIDFYNDFIINRFTNPDFNWFNGTTYRFPARLTDGSFPQSFAEANSLYAEQPTSFPSDDYPDSYRFIALAALSTQTGDPLGQKGYIWLKQHVNDQDELNIDPTWAITPRDQASNVPSLTMPFILSIEIK